MDHNLHANASLQHHHWGYGAGAAVPAMPQNHWIPPPQSHLSHHSDHSSLKRAMSESDCEELYSEESSKEQISPSNTGSCQLMSRKKRRGVIEKKRRDRINSSLTELKRLVPSAYEKQGSAKLEKAEILQLTVEHLKNIQGKGVDSLSYDPQRFAMEYHIIGFRECAAEVARYLVTIEGMDIQDPLRLRLMSHLQYFAQQRELSAKSCANATNWSTASVAGGYQPNCAVATPYQTYPTATAVATHSSHANAAASSSSTYMPNLAPIHPYPVLSASPSASNVTTQQQQQQPTQQQQQQQQQPTSSMHMGRSSTASAGSASSEAVLNQNQTQSSISQGQTTATQHEQQQQQQQQHQTATQQQQQQQQQHYTQDHQNGTTYIELTNSQAHNNLRSTLPTAPPTVTNSLAYSTTSAQYAPVSGTAAQDFNPNYTAASGSKPYRPWGAEMAY